MKIIIDTDDLGAIPRLIAAGFTDFHVQGAPKLKEPAQPAPPASDRIARRKAAKIRLRSRPKGQTANNTLLAFLGAHGPATFSEIKDALIQANYTAGTAVTTIHHLAHQNQITRMEGRQWALNGAGA